MYTGAKTVLRAVYGNSKGFEVKVGMHQGSALSPLLFVIVMKAISREFRVALLWELLYADDLAVIAETEEELIKWLNVWKENVESKGMRVNMNKTKVMISGEGEAEGCGKVRGRVNPVTSAGRTSVDIGDSAKLELVDKFCYLGDMLSVDGDADAAVESRIRIGWNKFRQLVPLLTNKDVSLIMRGRLYSSCVHTSVLHGNET